MFDFTPTHAAQAFAVIEKLQSAGFVAYLAGGCVRDAMLHRTPKDFDVATDATPDTVRDIFGRRRTLAFGASFGVIGVLGNAGTPTEVATFRSDGEYSDGRRPDSVRFGTAEHDARRRDFTINGMFYDPIAAKLIDFVGGETDLKRSMIRAIGDPHLRIGEDKLRMLRAVRIAAALGFEIESNTQTAIQQSATQVTVVSGERIGAEMRRMLGKDGATKAIELLFTTNLMRYVWPSFALAAQSNIQPSHRLISVAKQLVSNISPDSFVVAVAAIISQLAIDHESALNEITATWKLSCDEQRAIKESLRHRETILHADQLPWSIVQPIIASREAESIIATANAWAKTFAESTTGVEFCQQRFAWPREQLDPEPLITGDTLRELGFKPGPQFREVLQAIRDSQLDGLVSSESAAIKQARSLLSDQPK